MNEKLMSEFKAFCKSRGYILSYEDYDLIERYIDTFPEAQQEAVLEGYMKSYCDREKYKSSNGAMRTSAKRANLWLLNKVSEFKLRKSMEVARA